MTDEAALKAKFDETDTDSNGYIDLDEFHGLVGALGVEMSREAVAAAFLAIDVNGNGRIEFGEFSAWWSKYHAG